MTYYDEQLAALQEKIARAKQLSTKIWELKNQLDTLQEEVSYLTDIKLREQNDVDRLEGRSLAAFYYNVVGRMDEKLDQERREAYAARVKCDAAERELAAVAADLNRYEDEFAKLQGYQKQYDALFAEKTAAVKAAGGECAGKLLKLEEESSVLESRRKELQEAVCAGRTAHATAHEVMHHLNNAEGWSTFDLLGGGLLSDIAKHGELDEAQGLIEQLQSDLRRFRTELADIRIAADLQISVDDFLRFADYFFDNLFTDWAVMDQIQRSKTQVDDTIGNISDVLYRLENMLQDTETQQRGLKEELDRLVREAAL